MFFSLFFEKSKISYLFCIFFWNEKKEKRKEREGKRKERKGKEGKEGKEGKGKDLYFFLE